MSNRTVFIVIAVAVVGLVLYFTLIRKYTNSTLTAAELNGTLGSLDKNGNPSHESFWQWWGSEWDAYVENYLSKGYIFSNPF